MTGNVHFQHLVVIGQGTCTVRVKIITAVLPEDYCKEDPCTTSHGVGSWRGVDQELANFWATLRTKSCPGDFVLFFSPAKSVYKIQPFLLPRACAKSAWLEVDQKLDMGWPTFDTNIFEIAGAFLAVVLWQHPKIITGSLVTLENLLGIPRPVCVYPDVCLGIGDVSGKVPLPGQGPW